MTGGYVGRFAPSPTGPLHAGSLTAALASWLDARAHGGRWLVRIEDIDRPRCVAGAAELILNQLAACALLPDETPLLQSTRDAAYATSLQSLVQRALAYPCGCTRKEIDDAWSSIGAAHQRHEERIYPGTCRNGLNGKPARALRLLAQLDDGDAVVHWNDRRLGAQSQNVTQAVGDFVLQRADGLWAYQLAVVVDDAAQDISHVVRGEDLADNTARQVLLQRALGVPTPQYLHAPLVLAADGQKLSKQNGAVALDLRQPLLELRCAAATLGLPAQQSGTVADWLAQATTAWAARWHDSRPSHTANARSDHA